MTDQEPVKVKMPPGRLAGSVTHLVEYTCRHRDLITQPLYSDWLGRLWHCHPCRAERKIVWVDDD